MPKKTGRHPVINWKLNRRVGRLAERFYRKYGGPGPTEDGWILLANDYKRFQAAFSKGRRNAIKAATARSRTLQTERKAPRSATQSAGVLLHPEKTERRAGVV